MPKRSSNQKGTQQLTPPVIGAVVPDAEPAKPEKNKNPAAVALGRLGGIKGGKARAARLTSEQRTEIAKKAALKRRSKGQQARRCCMRTRLLILSLAGVLLVPASPAWDSLAVANGSVYIALTDGRVLSFAGK